MNWPGRIAPGEAPGMIHVVDMLPTLAKLAGASTAETKPLDGVDLWPALTGAGARDEIVYNVEPYPGGGASGPVEATLAGDLAADGGALRPRGGSDEVDQRRRRPSRYVAALQARAEALAREMAPPLFYGAALAATIATPQGDALDHLGAAED